MKYALTDYDHRFFEEAGYLVVPKVVSKAEAGELAVALLQERARIDDNPVSAYSRVPSVPLFHHPVQWKIRQNRQVYEAFASLLKARNLWVSIDRGKITIAQNAKRQPPRLHWDIDLLTHTGELTLQGLVALTDNPLGHGNFRCVPGFHIHAKRFTDLSYRDISILNHELENAQQQEVVLNAGDVLIWNAYLPHGNAPNIQSLARVVQFIRYFPCAHFDNRIRDLRLAMIRDGLSYRELRLGETPATLYEIRLTKLGRKLAGVDLWV